MHKLISSLNNAYSARHASVYVVFKNSYLILLQFLMKKNLIAYYHIKLFNSKKYIFIKLNYINGKPLFVLKLLAKKSCPLYYKAYTIKRKSTQKVAHYTLVSTSSGWQSLSRLCSYGIGGKLMIGVELTNKNIDG